jgi:hypothetical protein
MNFHLAFVADHDELAAAFDKVKSPAADLLHKGLTPDLAFHIAHGTTYHATACCGLGVEHRRGPMGVCNGGTEHLHGRRVAE